MITEIALPGLRNEKVPTKPRIVPKHPEHLFPLHSLQAFVGPRGSGKTNACVLLAKAYLDAGSFTRVFVLSPTYDSNAEFEEILQPDPEDVYTDSNNMCQAVTEIVAKIEEEAEKYILYLAYKAAYKRWKKGKHTFKDEVTLEHNNYEKPPDMPRPAPVMILDDLSHTEIYSSSRNNPFNNLCLRHRHLAAKDTPGGAIGVSIMMLVQNFKTGVPKFLRQNIQQFFIWPTHDFDVLKSMYGEFANLCSYESFYHIYLKAVEGEHNFLTVDPNAKDKSRRFRRNFDQLLVIPSSDSFAAQVALTHQNESKSSTGLHGSKRKRSDVENAEGV
jgi:hypothetical protein